MTDFQKFKKKYDRRRFERINDEIMMHLTSGEGNAGSSEVKAVKEFYKDVEKMLETRDKIIKECRDKEKLEMAKSRLALGKSLHLRLSGDSSLQDTDVIDKIKEEYTGMRARGKPGKRSKRKGSKRKRTKKASKKSK